MSPAPSPSSERTARSKRNVHSPGHALAHRVVGEVGADGRCDARLPAARSERRRRPRRTMRSRARRVGRSRGRASARAVSTSTPRSVVSSSARPRTRSGWCAVNQAAARAPIECAMMAKRRGASRSAMARRSAEKSPMPYAGAARPVALAVAAQVGGDEAETRHEVRRPADPTSARARRCRARAGRSGRRRRPRRGSADRSSPDRTRAWRGSRPPVTAAVSASPSGMRHVSST